MALEEAIAVSPLKIKRLCLRRSRQTLTPHLLIFVSMAKAPHPPADALPSTYEEAQAELNRLVLRLEVGDMPLEELLTGYQRGAELLKFCRARLQAVEDQIKVLDAQGLKLWAPRA